jgi:hypothetical protein
MTKEKMTLDRVNAFLTNIINGQPGTIDIRDTIGAKKIDAKTKKLPILKKPFFLEEIEQKFKQI